MFFFLSKTLQYAFMPMVWVFGLMCWALFTKNPKKRSKILIFCLLLTYVLSNELVVNMAYKAWEETPVAIQDIQKPYDVGIILGGFTNIIQKPRDRVYVSQAADRALHAGLLYKKGLVKKLLVSGGSGIIDFVETTEADNIKQLLVDYGVKETDIIIENDSKNTLENARFSRKIIDQQFPNARLLLFTSAFHCPRAKGCFEKENIKVDLFPVDFRYSKPSTAIDKLIFPTEGAFYKAGLLIHEWVGFVVYKLLGYC